MTYAGRLDPMASGKLLVLIGETCKERSRYDKLDKEYEFEVLLGMSSDTGDILGMLERSGTATPSLDGLNKILQSLIGEHTFPYPAYSSKTVKGIPLFQYASQNRLETITIPTQKIRIYSISLLSQKRLPFNTIATRSIDLITRFNPVQNPRNSNADFRKPAVLAGWHEYQNDTSNAQILTFRATVNSGTYVRTIAEYIGKELGTTAMTLSIHRSRIGKYQPIYKKLGFWTMQS
ncbi:MAG: ine55 [Candidatus Kaiserbacteria bacterium]|nr:ine55 [Candidatus Kaiserbacteria bacterium]